jgi:hypothetical protein
MTRHPRILDAGKETLLGFAVAVANPASLDFDPDGPRSGLRDLSFRQFQGPFGRDTWTTRIVAISNYGSFRYAALVSRPAGRRTSTSFCAERPKKW